MPQNKFNRILNIIVIYLFLCSLSFADVPANHSTLQEAIDAATNGDTITVSPGIYTGENNKNLSFYGKSITLVCDSESAQCTIDCENSGRGFYFNSNEDENTIISGFIITNGKVSRQGGGILCISSSPTITNCVITGNTAQWARGGNGGGLACVDASPKIYNTVIQNNTAKYNGSGIYCRGNSQPILSGCVISNNANALYGGGISAHEQSHLTIINTMIFSNSARQGGGGISCTSSPKVQNSVISNNDAKDGGGVASYFSAPTIDNCLISSNSAENGGGIAAQALSNPVITNSSISNNSASKKGSGISLYPSAEPTITSCTIWGKEGEEAIAVDTTEESISVTNTGLAIVSNSAVQGGYTGDQNVSLDPIDLEGLIDEYSSPNPTFSLTGGGLTAYRYKLDDDTEWSEELVISIPIELTQLADGNHTLYVLGKDSLGNWQSDDAAVTFQWSVDTASPTILNLTNTSLPVKSITWEWTASEAAQFRYLVDNSPDSTPSGDYSDITSVTQSTGDGVYYIHVQAKDFAGNESDVKTVQANLDNTKPEATMSYSTTDTTAGAVIATLVPKETVTITNNNGELSKTFNENGSFTFTFTDAAGNIGEETAEIDWIYSSLQIIETDPQTPKALTQTSIYMDINYTNSTMDTALSGLGLRIHYPSDALTYQGVTNVLENVSTPATDIAETIETDDGNTTTDKYVEIGWQDTSTNWPGGTLPTRLCTVTFLPASNLAEGYTCSVIYKASFIHTGYLFYANPVTVEIQRFTLDVDANQTPDALTDGLLIIRYLFGLKSGKSLIENAVDLDNGLRTSSENINAYIKNSLSYIDIDSNGRADALTDGILILRYLFGLTEGESLIGDSVDSQGERTTSESIKNYLDSLMP